ncbi:MAG: hypothetical protein JW840_05960 [Candidatus Thermoplasmatota archaeon]|nr:hypothetical protein [Candidatus Thermoplasmatota archaeon]
MNKKILSLLFILILLVSVTVSYAFFNQPASTNGYQTTTDGDVDEDILNSEIDSALLDEDEDIEIGDMI